jgi:hypothetical protein
MVEEQMCALGMLLELEQSALYRLEYDFNRNCENELGETSRKESVYSCGLLGQLASKIRPKQECGAWYGKSAMRVR